MKRTGKIAKTTILLIVFVILAISLCSSQVYAWFYNTTAANGTISGEVVSFYFTTNGTFNQNVTISSGDSVGNNSFVYENSPKTGMYPGQTISAKLILSNENSNLPAKYSVKVKADGNHFPADCLLTVTESGTAVHARGLFAAGKSIVSNATIGYGDGAKKEYVITLEWLMTNAQNQAAGVSVYADEKVKNAADLAFMSSCVNEQGQDSAYFTVVFEITAEQN